VCIPWGAGRGGHQISQDTLVAADWVIPGLRQGRLWLIEPAWVQLKVPPPWADQTGDSGPGTIQEDLGRLNNLVERLLAELTNKRLRRGIFRSIADLQAAINRYLRERNRAPKPFVWTKSADTVIFKYERAKGNLSSRTGHSGGDDPFELPLVLGRAGFTCWNSEVVRLAFTLDCHDREMIGWVVTTAGIPGEMIRDMMVRCVEQRFGTIRAPHPVQWLSDDGSIFAAHRTPKSPWRSTWCPAPPRSKAWKATAWPRLS
jgi:transposase InsO family protein